MKSLGLFVVAAACEIAGCYAVWMYLRQGKSAWWLAAGAVPLIIFAVLLTRAESGFAGRAYAAYGGVYIVSSLLWLWAVERQRPTVTDAAGAVLCLLGAGLILLRR